MGWFGNDAWKADIKRVEERIAIISAHLNCAQIIAFDTLKALPPNEREQLLDRLRNFVANFGTSGIPKHVPEHLAQLYRNELSWSMQQYIETLKSGRAK